MIKTYGDLLLDLAQRERKKLDDFKISHPPTIGQMYEGLSQELLNLSVPDGIVLDVVGGFVEDDDGNQSGQIDCMLVAGSGRQVPSTDLFVWNIKHVIAVFEIKKTLNKTALIDSFAHLNTVRNLERPELLLESGVDMSSVVRTFAQLTGTMPPRSLSEFTDRDRTFFNTLAREHHGPIRIAFGYHGYKTEKGFRNALNDHLTANVMTHGFGVSNFPQLMISGDYTLAKINGEPYVPVLNDDGAWVFYVSTSLNPQMMVLEYVWSRLDRLFGLPDETWGDDLENDIFNAYLAGKPGTTEDGEPGWHYTYMSADPARFDDKPIVEPWEPTFLTDQQATAVGLLCRGVEVRVDDPDLAKELLADGVDDVDGFWQSLLRTPLIALSADAERLVLIARRCDLACLPGGQWVAGENSTGRLTRWVQRRGDGHANVAEGDGR